MSNTSLTKPSETAGGLSDLIKQPKYANRFAELFRDRAPQFASSLIQVGNSLPGVEPASIITAAMTATALDLPIDRNLGFAWIVPYKSGERKLAQFQMGWKGYVQLALRTNQYRCLNVIEVYEGELIECNRLTGDIKLDSSSKTSDTVVGYAAYMELVSGFRHTEFWTLAEVKAHAQRYSQSYRSGYDSPWKSNFDEMAMKTVVANMIKKWGPMSVTTQRAYTNDGAVVIDVDASPVYPDNDSSSDTAKVAAPAKPKAVSEKKSVEKATTPAAAKTTAAPAKTAEPEPEPEQAPEPEHGEPEPDQSQTVDVQSEKVEQQAPVESQAPKEKAPPKQKLAPPTEGSQADQQADKLALIAELSKPGLEISLDQFKDWTKTSGRDAKYGVDTDKWNSWDDVQAEYASVVFRSPKAVGNMRLIYINEE